ncbi:MAG: right-handed parallel beta-helix repeat-containing protein [Agriterribacter sp.]
MKLQERAAKKSIRTGKVSYIIIFLVFSITLHAQQIVDVTGFGIQPNSFEDAVPAVKKAIEACKNKSGITLSFPKGRYDFWSGKAEEREYYISNTSSETECPSKFKKIGLLFEQMKNIIIEGNGSTFIFHGKMITWAFDHCSDMQLQNVEIDFERPSMSEMTFESVSDSLIIANIHPDSKYDVINHKLVWYGEGWTNKHFHAILVKPDSTMFYSSWDPFLNANAKELTPNRIAFYGEFSKYKVEKGDVLTIRDPIRDHVGAFINQSKNISLQNVQMRYMHGLGIVSQFCENLHYNNVQVVPSHGRQIATFADAMHFSGCKGDILIENCRYSGLHDDPVNVHGTHLQVSEMITATIIKVKFMHEQTYGFPAFFAGDSVGLVHSAALQVFGYGVIKSAKLLTPREMELEFTTPVSAGLQKGDCLENITWTPNLTIRNCVFEKTNTRGLLVTTRHKVLIENNRFFRTGMHAILIADDASGWYESGPVQDVTIRNNTFQECGYNSYPDNYVINIAPENHQPVKNYFVHRNIHIENNTFLVYDAPVLSARSTNGLSFIGNTIIKTHFMPPSNQPKPTFALTACKNVLISKNNFQQAEEPSIQLNGMYKKDMNTDIKKIIVGK